MTIPVGHRPAVGLEGPPSVTLPQHAQEHTRRYGGADDAGHVGSHGGHEEPLSPFEIDTLRRMSPAEKLAVMTSLIREAYRLKRASIRLFEPDLSEEELGRRVREAMAGDG